MEPTTIEQIRLDAERLVEQIRQLSREQKDLWQKVPYLALQANGRSGYNDQYSRAYQQGFWALESSASGGYYSIYVDLETGELVSAHDPRRSAGDEDVLSLLKNIDELNAGAIVDDLEKASKRPTFRGYNLKKQAEWRNSLKKEYGLKPNTYKRRACLEEIARNNSIAGLVD